MEEDKAQSFVEASQTVELEIKSTKKQSTGYQIENSPEQEISQLRKRLKHQLRVRRSLERELGHKSSCHDNVSDVSMPKPTTELIKEISALELEVSHLEKYLLTLYRKAFDQQVSTSSTPMSDEKLKSPMTIPRTRCLQFSKSDIMQSREVTKDSLSNLLNVEADNDEKQVDSVIERCHSSISQCSVLATKAPQAETLGKALRACYSQPLSMMEYAQNTSSKVTSLADHLGTHISDHSPETPNKISEDMIKYILFIYYKFADPPTSNLRLSPPNSSFSSMSVLSPKDKSDLWSLLSPKDSSFDVRLDKALHVEELKEYNGPCIYRDDHKLGDFEDMLMNFRSLIGRLEQVNPRKMTHEQKLAFWINIHNALVLHVFLAYGIPQNNLKRLVLLMKAAYNIGGHLVSADMIQSSILGCRMSRSVQWLRVLVTSKSNFKSEYERQAYSINHPQPLLHFALCSGSHSDPVVRVYTPKRVLQELEMAKDEYIRATFGIKGDKKHLLPKILESFSKETGLCPNRFTEMIQQCFPESVRKSLKNFQPTKSGKSITEISNRFSFRYLMSKEVVK